MKRRFVAILLWYAALFVVAATGWPGARAQAPATTPTAEPRLREGSPHLLRAVRAATLARALADEDRASKDGTYTPVSFPLPMCIFDGGLCGALNSDGTVAVTPQFDWVGTFREGRALVRSGGLYGYVDTSGRVVAEPKYELAGNYWRGFAEVSIDGKSGLIDLEGNRILEPRFARAHPFSADVFWVNDGARHYDGQPGVEELVNYEHSDVTRDVSATGKWGLVDRTGTWIRKPEFTAIMRYDRDDGSLVLVKADSGWGVIKPDGTWFLEPKFEHLGRPGSGPAPARVAGRSGYIDRTGTFIIAPNFDDTRHFERDGLAAASVGKLYGLIDRTGAWVIEPKYDWLVHGSASYQGLIWVRVGGKWGAIDRSGQVVVQPQFSQSGTVCDDGWVVGRADGKQRVARREGAALAMPDGELSGTDCERPFQIRIDDRFGYVDRMLKPITEVKFESLSEFFRGIALVKLDGRFGYIKQDGTWLVGPRFEEASPFWADFTAVKLNGKFGCVKRDGTWLVEPRFAEAPRSCSDLITKIDSKFSFMNPDGTWSIDPRFERVWRGYGIAVTSGLVAAKFEEKWGFIDASGALVIEDKYDEFSYFQRGISWVKAGTSWCAIDRRGRKVPTLPCLEADPRPKAGTLTGRFRGY